jgi:hypothetical protein
VAVGEEIAGDGDGAGEFSFSEEGACINDSRELLAALGVGAALGARVAVAFAGTGLGFCGVAST